MNDKDWCRILAEGYPAFIIGQQHRAERGWGAPAIVLASLVAVTSERYQPHMQLIVNRVTDNRIQLDRRRRPSQASAAD